MPEVLDPILRDPSQSLHIPGAPHKLVRRTPELGLTKINMPSAAHRMTGSWIVESQAARSDLRATAGSPRNRPEGNSVLVAAMATAPPFPVQPARLLKRPY
jgi:hypothetical protein